MDGDYDNPGPDNTPGPGESLGWHNAIASCIVDAMVQLKLSTKAL